MFPFVIYLFQCFLYDTLQISEHNRDTSGEELQIILFPNKKQVLKKEFCFVLYFIKPARRTDTAWTNEQNMQDLIDKEKGAGKKSC